MAALSAADFRGLRVLVAGAGRSNTQSSIVLAGLGAQLLIADPKESAFTPELAAVGASYAGDLIAIPPDIDLVLTTPGRPPHSPLLLDAAARGVPVVGEVEIAWWLRDQRVPWLGVTGSNGKTTTVGMLTSILRAAGNSVAEVGNIGPPVLPAAVDPATSYDVFVVELSSFQLHWAPSLRLAGGALLNIAADHLDWHGSIQAYAEDKARIFNPDGVNVFNLDDAMSSALSAALPPAARRIGFGAGVPASGNYGVADGQLVAHLGAAQPLCGVDSVRAAGPHNLANALAAAALASVVGVQPEDVRRGLEAYLPGSHRMVLVTSEGQVDYVDDSKATNPHAAAASLQSYDDIVWIAGGLLKGATVEDLGELVMLVRSRLRAVVLIGKDRAVIAEALRRHAPDVPVREVGRTDDMGMRDAVVHARALALSGEGATTVLLAPAAASMDMFSDYAARGDAFAVAARELSNAM